MVLAHVGVCPVLLGVDDVLYTISWRRFGIAKTIGSVTLKLSTQCKRLGALDRCLVPSNDWSGR